MNQRQVIATVLEGRRPPCVPWEMGFTLEASEKLRDYYGQRALETVLDNHFAGVGSGVGFFTDLVHAQPAYRELHATTGS